MTIKFRCPGCGVEDVAAEAMAGQKVSCAGCGGSIRLPSPTPPPAPGDPIRFRCPGCGKALAAPAHLAGKKITCKSCGLTGLKIPGGPASSPSIPAPAPAPTPAKPRPTPGQDPFAAGPSAIDLYGLDEAPQSPTPRPRGAGDDLFADSVARPAVAGTASEEALPPRAGAFEAMTAEKKKKINKRADKIAKASPSFAGAGMSVSFGTIIAITLFGWRLYRIGHRVTRGLDNDKEPVAVAPFEPGPAPDPKAAAAEGDRDVARMLKEPGAAEAREWLDPVKYPNHGVFELGNERARAMVAGFYERGARRVSVLDAEPLGNAVVTSMIAVELPDEPDKRAHCLAWETQYLEGEDPTKDLGQKYLLIMTD